MNENYGEERKEVRMRSSEGRRDGGDRRKEFSCSWRRGGGSVLTVQFVLKFDNEFESRPRRFLGLISHLDSLEWKVFFFCFV